MVRDADETRTGGVAERLAVIESKLEILIEEVMAIREHIPGEMVEHAQRIKAHAEQRGMTAGQFALNWVLNNRIVSSVLAGPRTLEQWTEYLGALEHGFSAEDEALVDSMVRSGHPSTPGYNDPKYPLSGRPTYD